MLKRIVALALGLMMFCSVALAQVLPGFTMRHGDRDQKRICITIDDLANTEMVQAIFDLGQELGVPMTFFVLGYVLEEEDADLWRAIAESDCEIGNHTYNHLNLPTHTQPEIVNNLNSVQRRLDEVLGYHYPMQVMRPPFGNVYKDGSTTFSARAVDAAGYKHMVLWDVSQTDPELCMKAVQNGSILLFHSIPKDLHCLEIVLPQLIEQGYEFVTVSEMGDLPPVEIVYPDEQAEE